MQEQNLNNTPDVTQKYMPKISFARKFGYGFGSIAEVICDDFISAFSLFFLTDCAGLHAGFAGLIISITVFLGAITDTIAGPISDRANTPIGRRHPFLIGSAIPMAFAGILMFTTWDSMEGMGKNMYYAIVICVFWISYSFWLIPYNSLGSTLSLDDEQRTSNRIFAMIFEYIAYYFSGGVPTALVAIFLANGDALDQAWHKVALVIMLVGLAANIVCIITTWKKDLDFTEVIEKAEKTNPFKDFAELAKMKAARILILYGTLIYRIGYGFASTLTLYFFLTGHGRSEGEISIYYLVNSITGVATTLFLYWAAKKWDNYKILMIGCVWMGIWVGMFTFFHIGSVGILIVYAAIRQIPSTIYWAMILPVMFPLNEIYEFRTGQRKEGTVQSFYGFTQKIGYGLTALLSGLFLTAIGYDGSLAEQSEATASALRHGYPLLCGGCYLLTAVVLIKYPVRKKQFQRLNEELAKKREGLPYTTEGFEELIK